jgi:purine catabolism regulator
LLTRARAAGLPVNRRVFVPLVVRPLDSGSGPELHDGDDVRELIGRLMDQDALVGLVARIDGGGTAVLLSMPHDQAAGAAVDRLALRLRESLAGHGRTIVVGAGAECTVLDEVRRSFVEAVHVADAAVADPPAGPVARLRDVRLRGLVRLLRDEPELQAFIERELGPLLEHQQLLDVLRTYLRTGRNKSLAAQIHHVSRPALYRRLRSIEALLGIDLEDWDQLTSLYVAILAYEAQHASGSEA